jgi:hypothetical protein
LRLNREFGLTALAMFRRHTGDSFLKWLMLIPLVDYGAR